MLRSLVVLIVLSAPVHGAETLFLDDFESGLSHWQPLSAEHAVIIREPGKDNRVLELTPRNRAFSHVILTTQLPEGPLRMEGRVLFPTDGDGYLGLIYNHQASDERTDFGVIYLKSNGSYLRVSPHYDGNPSWRLYEEMKVPIEGDSKIQPNRWYDFRLDVDGRTAALSIGDPDTPLIRFDEAPGDSGALGLEARPGRGDPVWVDDIRVSTLPAGLPPAPSAESNTRLVGWQHQGAIEPPTEDDMSAPDLGDEGWIDLAPDSRGAIITGLLTQYDSGDRSVVYLRAEYEQEGDEPSAWLAMSSANRVDVWMDGYYRGTVAPDRFIWSDHVTSPVHNGARLPILLSPGNHKFIFRVHGDRFAGGGFFADIVYPETQ